MAAIENLCVIGVGLIGGSLARALREAGYCSRITGSGRDEKNLRRAVELGVIDDYRLSAGEAVRHADMVVVAVPLGAIRGVFEAVAGELKPGAILTDVGSAKGSVVADACAVFGAMPPTLVPGHPIAGTERSGVEASFSTLYRQRRIILTPVASTSEQATAAVRAMWQAAGAEVETMTVEHHDMVLAATSHLPHMLAYVLVDALSRLKDKDEIFRYAAGGFRDFTRIASSDPTMWRDICVANKEAIVDMIQSFREDLDELSHAIEQADAAHVFDIFSRAKAARDRYADGVWAPDLPGGEN